MVEINVDTPKQRVYTLFCTYGFWNTQVLQFERTVKLGYNKLGFNEHSDITNRLYTN